MKRVLVFLGALALSIQLNAQDDPEYHQLSGKNLNTITTAVPFLTIAPDARGGAMGDAGVSSSPDANSIYWNAAKLAFLDKKMGFAMSYSPWLRKLVNDINLAYLSFFYKLDKNQAVGFSLRYFTLGEIIFRQSAEDQGFPVKPNEFAFTGTYSRKLSNNLSGAVSARFIYSNLTLGQFVQGAETTAGTSIAADVSLYWRKDVDLFDVNAELAWGLIISNIGNKISYSAANIEKDFIPTNLRFGPSVKLELDDYNELSFMVDVNKLLVPTPPVYALDKNGQPIIGPDGDRVIAKGKDPNVSVIQGMLQSFYDAPEGFSEEMREFYYGFGAEYWYDKQFAVRGGFFYEDRTKGNRKFFTLGAGLRYNVFGLDFAYLIPLEQQNPLENTLRFTLHFDFDAFQNQNNN
ncbi:MAG: type IX secretion system outer membrane channel protein PorV [Bacteroidales bacterium]|nr:type IX secretion system outer membrane channel protein PorV [Bacteroidales bacterium]MCF8343302.1 type IX secretion system outer membrane channel protein PorV [Bacteroidales bacterium]MCF8349868.1 type IX secretion system outer membrane channel protein PorV [Bacteroidales bacterium]MCF8375536.1 type IX secretion system outer membrane channel protein PorV [Bacteroidales bacterium]MCF8399935.1 type IX secretion system outer membrane channel protein PorV [Bacteroidales bacterium]